MVSCLSATSLVPPPAILGTSHQIYVGNLEPHVTEDDIREFFAECGDIASVRAAAAALEVTLLFNALYIRVDVVAISLSPDF